jgi:hypothetical protein
MSAKPSATTARLSLYEEARREAERHKWIESQKRGHDMGEAAIFEWYRLYWRHYWRHRRVEHLQGRRWYREFEEHHFGCLYSRILTGDLLVDRILDRVYEGQENLDIINWALEWGLSVEPVLEILAQIDVNRARPEPKAR